MILVLGAGGKVGVPLVEALRARGVRFRAGYRSPAKLEAARRSGVDAVPVEYLEPATLDAAMRGVERVFVLAPPVEHLEALERNIVDAAGRAGVSHLVKLSVWAARTADFTFGRPHRAVEELIERSGIPWTFLRPNGFMQTLLASAPSIVQSGVYAFPHGGKVSLIDTRDVAEVAAVALTGEGHEGRAYELSGPEALDDADQIRIISETVGRQYTYVPVGDDDWRRGALGFGLPQYLVDALVDLARFQRTGRGAAVTGEVERLTGSPPRPFRRFAEDYAAAFR